MNEETPMNEQPDEVTQEQVMGAVDFKECCFTLRLRLELLKKETMLVFHKHPAFVERPEEHAERVAQHEEMKANLMLAYRHLEDARMRFGKAIQAFDGGESCYPR